jgi:hypothetical protein
LLTSTTNERFRPCSRENTHTCITSYGTHTEHSQYGADKTWDDASIAILKAFRK